MGTIFAELPSKTENDNYQNFNQKYFTMKKGIIELQFLLKV